MLKWMNEHLEEALMTIMLLLITVIISYSVIMRYIFNNSPSWAEEITRFLFIWSSFISIGLCVRLQSSIRIDLLLTALSEKNTKILLAIVNLIIIAVLLYWLKGGVNVTRTLIRSGQTSPALLIPMWTIYGSSVVGFTLGIIRCAQQVCINIAGLKSAEGGK